MTVRRDATPLRALALMTILAACSNSPTEPGESGTRWNAAQTARETRSGVTLVLNYDSSSQEFIGTVTNTTNATVTDVRVEIHLSNRTELGPTPRIDLAANEEETITLDASGQNFSWYSVHVEIGSSSS